MPTHADRATSTVLGVGVITRNRLAILRETLAALEEFTTVPYVLVVADDGSDDGTARWARDRRGPVVTGPRRGCAWNKNRALLYLAARTTCDPLLLLEDDTRPTAVGWQDVWIAAAHRRGHVPVPLRLRRRRPTARNRNCRGSVSMRGVRWSLHDHDSDSPA